MFFQQPNLAQTAKKQLSKFVAHFSVSRGAFLLKAEITPAEPDQGNACAGRLF
jgi:hypothetical protein